MKQKQVKVFAPATVGNFGAGFDVLGFAIDEPGDIVIAKRTKEPGLIFKMQKHEQLSSTKPNVAEYVASLILEEVRPPFGIALTLQKKMPIGSGLGSSGASCAAAAFAVNTLLQKPMAKHDLLRFVVEGERIASGAPHADNVAPSLLGGACLISSYDPLTVVQLPVKNVFHWVVVHPHCIVATEVARKLLPTSLPLSTTTQQMGALGSLITGLLTGDKLLTGDSIRDYIAEPARAKLIPGFSSARDAAIRAGALGFSISGSGPSVFALASSTEEAEKIARAIKAAFKKYARLESDAYISRFNMQGAKIMETST